METNKLLTAPLLDILFDGRNKEYGAYELRNAYNNRLKAALAIAFIVTAIALSIFSINQKVYTDSITDPYIFEPTLIVPEVEKIVLPKNVLSKQEIVKTLQSTRPVIVDDILVTEAPIENLLLINGTIDTRTTEGPIESGISQPVQNNTTHIEPVIKVVAEDESPIMNVEIQAVFKGDWTSFVKKQIEKNIDELVEAGESGTCIVRFVVSKTGKVSNVEAITMKGTKLAEIAVNAIKKGPDWIPAKQNGVHVNAYRQQPVTFTITD